MFDVIEIDFFSWDVFISSWCKNFSFQKAGWETGVWGLRFSRKRLNQGWKVCEGADTLLPLHLIDAAGPRLLRWRTSLLALLGALVVVLIVQRVQSIPSVPSYSIKLPTPIMCHIFQPWPQQSNRIVCSCTHCILKCKWFKSVSRVSSVCSVSSVNSVSSVDGVTNESSTRVKSI